MSMLSPAPSRPEPEADGKIRVMIVDDAVVVRGLLTRWLGDIPEIDVIGSFINGRQAVDALDRLDPHVIILDIEMPEMDGLTALPLILKKRPRAQVIMSSTLTTRNADISLRALGLGARDYIPKPEGNHGVTTSVDFRRELIEKVSALGGRVSGISASPRTAAVSPRRPKVSPVAIRDASANANTAAGLPPLRPIKLVKPRILAIGSSTGGPQALKTVFKAIAPAIPSVPVVLAQHMPASFTTILAEHIGRECGAPSREGTDGATLEPGTIYVAPGGRHMVVKMAEGTPVIRLHDGPPVNFCKPAVDPLFESVADCFRNSALGVVLTGMGHDGAKGAVRIADAGGNVVVQDEETSVVWGMPGATAQAGAPCAILPLDQIGSRIGSMIKGIRR